MPESKIIFYKEGNSIPMLDWLKEVSGKEKKVFEKCFAQINLLKMKGYELHRPYADYLGNGIYELRISFRRMQYRLLYFFYGQNVVVLTHGFVKEGKIPNIEIDRAIERKNKFEAKPNIHSFEEGDSSDV